MKPTVFLALAILAATSVQQSRAADTTVVKVLAYRADGTVAQGTGRFFACPVCSSLLATKLLRSPKPFKMRKIRRIGSVFVAFLALLIASCVTGERMSSLSPGMTKDQVISLLGHPDGYQAEGEY